MIGLLSALEEENHLLQAKLDLEDIVMYAGLTFNVGQLNQMPVVMVRCGVGKVNAAATTQLMIDKFQTTSVIFSGLAGSLVEYLNRGDVVISNYVVQHDIDLTAFGRRVGEMSDRARMIEANPKLVQLATEAYDDSIAIGSESCQAVVGTIVTGDTFVSDPGVIKWLQREFGAVAAEMEGAAVGQVCLSNKVPFVILRVISDKAGSAAAGEFIQFLSEASETTSAIICELISKLAMKEVAHKPTSPI